MKKSKRTMSRILCVVMALTMLTSTMITQAFAAGTDPVYEEYTNVSTYRGSEKTYPLKSGYVFAGWYKQSGESYAPMSETEADAASAAYAKFVDANVLGAKYQQKMGSTAGSDKTDLRMLTSVDSLSYRSVGFTVTINGKSVECTSNKVYATITGYSDGNVAYQPTVFSDASRYFMAYNLTNIPNSVFTDTITVVPQWTTLDGTTVTAPEAKREIVINDELPDFFAGIGFESALDVGAIRQRTFTEGDQTGEPIYGTVDSIERVSYASAGIAKPANGGDYLLKLSKTGSNYPSFRINLGEALPVGSTLTFDVYTVVDNWTGGNHNFEYSKKNSAGGSEGGISDWFAPQAWHTVQAQVIGAYGGETYVDLFLGTKGDDATEETNHHVIYLDNLQITSAAVALDVTAGVNFEIARQSQYLSAGSGNVERVSYADAGITAPAANGSYAMKVSRSDFSWPGFTINFGKELPAGTYVSFDAYAVVAGGYKNAKFEMGGVSSNEFALNTWHGVMIKLTAAASSLTGFFNAETTGAGESANCAVYIDNLITYEPYTLDLTAETVDFEHIGMVGAVSGAGTTFASAERVSYADAGITKEDGGEYLMKLSGNSNQWPNFIIYFGKTLPAGSVISFDSYLQGTTYTSVSLNYDNSYKGSRNAWEPDRDTGWKAAQPDAWTHFNVVTGIESDRIQLFLNDDIAGEDLIFYIDNLSASAPFVMDITAGTVDFEDARQASYVTKIEGNGTSVDSIEWISYADVASIGSPTGGGSHLLKLGKVGNNYPALRIQFGKTLTAGTEIAFDTYTVVDNWTGGNHNFEFSGSDFRVNGGNATDWFADKTWTAVSFTLPIDSDHVDLFFGTNADGSTESTNYHVIYIDNLKVAE